MQTHAGEMNLDIAARTDKFTASAISVNKLKGSDISDIDELYFFLNWAGASFREP
jgi:hypothetical protein